MAYTAQFPISSFLDVDGKPLENGYVYIGTAGLDPVANPITAYWDAAATQVAAQPIRTIGGYPSNNGVRSRLYVNAVDYSIKVTNVNGTDTVPVALYNAEEFFAADIIFLQAGAGAVPRTVESKLRDVVSVKDFGAVGDGVADDTAAIQNAVNAAATTGSEVYMPAGLYKTTTTIVLNRKVTLRGQGNPFPVAAFDPSQQFSGAVINKAHSGHAITVTGSGAYSESAGIYCISIISNNNTYATGDGIRIDNVGSYTVEQCSVWSCGGNGFSFGVSAGDVTGQIFIRNLYVNNCSGYAYYFRCKWLRAYNIVSDGCTWGAWFQDSPESYVDGFHFEGFSTGGIRLAGASGWCTFIKGFVALTAATPYHAIYIENVAGNVSHTFNSVKCIGRNEPGVVGALILAAAQKTRFSDCYFSLFPNAIQNFSSYTVIANTVFDSNFGGVYEEGSYTRITGCTFDSTTGPWDINHVAGGEGVWSGNKIDTTIASTLFGQIGNYGTNIVVDNSGFKTKSGGITGAIASGTNIPHGLVATPQSVLISPVSPFALPADFTIGFNSTNITPTWTGGNLQLSWQAFAACANQG